MRAWVLVLLLPLAGCIGGDGDPTCEGLGALRVGDLVTYTMEDQGRLATVRTPTLWPAADPFLDTSSGRDHILPLGVTQFAIEIVDDADGLAAVYSAADAEFARESFDEAGRLRWIGVNGSDGDWRRFETGGLPPLLGGPWVWGQDAYQETRTIRADDVRVAEGQWLRVDAAWRPGGCGGRLDIGPALTDHGDDHLFLDGFQAAFDGEAWPARFTWPAADITWHRTDLVHGDGPRPAIAPPAVPDALPVVSLPDLLDERPLGFAHTMQEASDAVRRDPRAIAFFQEFPDAGLLAYAHGPLGDAESRSDIWLLQYWQEDGDTIMTARVRFEDVPGAAAATTEIETMSVGGDWPTLQPPLVSFEALEAWHAQVSTQPMEAILCYQHVASPLCIFGSAAEVGWDMESAILPGSVEGEGFSSGYRVGLNSGIVADAKLASP